MNSRAGVAPIQIALDGPSASGKSTVGALLADRWKCEFLDTGMMYRTVTMIAQEQMVHDGDKEELGRIAASTKFEIFKRDDGEWRLKANGKDVTDDLYSDEITRRAANVSAVSEVRKNLVRQQRDLAGNRRIVMAGRDIGTVVLADALIKIYLDASPATRAERRTKDISGNSQEKRYEEVLRSIQERDRIDSSRADSPLRKADDAVYISTDDLTAEEAVDKIIELTKVAEAFEALS